MTSAGSSWLPAKEKEVWGEEAERDPGALRPSPFVERKDQMSKGQH